MADIYTFIKGDEYLSGSERVVKNAMESISKKIQKFFGFSVFQKEKSVVYVQMNHKKI